MAYKVIVVSFTITKLHFPLYYLCPIYQHCLPQHGTTASWSYSIFKCCVEKKLRVAWHMALVKLSLLFLVERAIDPLDTLVPTYAYGSVAVHSSTWEFEDTLFLFFGFAASLFLPLCEPTLVLLLVEEARDCRDEGGGTAGGSCGGGAGWRTRRKKVLFLESENYMQLLWHLYRCILNLSAAALISYTT